MPAAPRFRAEFPSAFFGVSKPPYTEWQWHDLGMFVGGPNFIQMPVGQWIAAGRFYNGDTPKTKLAALDVEKKTIEPILELPSGGDTSYPGLVWHDDALVDELLFEPRRQDEHLSGKSPNRIVSDDIFNRR